MRRALALVAVVWASTAGAVYIQPMRFLVKNLPTEATGQIVQTFLTSATGAPTYGDVCTTNASDLSTGATNWFCVRGDGTSTDSATGYGVSVVGAPPITSSAHPSNGLDFSNATHFATSTGNYYRTGSVASPSGSFSVGAMFEKDSTAQGEIITKFGGAGKRGFNFEHTTGTPSLIVYKTDASASSRGTATNAAPIRAPACVIFTYQFVTDGTSVITPYVNGALSSTALTNAVGPMQVANERIDVGDQESDDARVFAGKFHWAFYTEKVLDATAVANICKTALGTLTDAAGTAVAFSGGISSVYNSGGTTLGWAGLNVPPVGANGLHMFLGTTNRILRSEELENAAWTATNATVAANSATARDGYTTMDTVTTSVNTGTVAQPNTVTSSTGPWTLGADTRSTAGTTTASFGMTCGAGNAATCVCYSPVDGTTCTASMSTATCFGLVSGTTTPKRWGLTMTCSSATTTITPFFTGGEYGVATGSQIWGLVKFETGAQANPYIITTSAAASSSASNAPLPFAASFNANRGCSRVSFTPGFSGLLPVAGAILGLGVSNRWLAYRDATGTNGKTQATDASHSPAFDNAWTAGSAETIRTTWGYGSLSIYNDADGLSASTAFASFPSIGTASYLGTLSNGVTSGGGIIGATVWGDGRRACNPQ